MNPSSRPGSPVMYTLNPNPTSGRGVTADMTTRGERQRGGEGEGERQRLNRRGREGAEGAGADEENNANS